MTVIHNVQWRNSQLLQITTIYGTPQSPIKTKNILIKRSLQVIEKELL